MVELRYTTHAGRGICRSVPDAQIEKAVLGMFQARIECEVFNEQNECVGAVEQAVGMDGRLGNYLTWWCEPEPNAQAQLDAREEYGC